MRDFEVLRTRRWPDPWRRVPTPRGITAGYAPHLDGVEVAAAYLRTVLHASTDEVLALILDPKDTGLAGDLARWERRAEGRGAQRVTYEVRMPPPLRRRTFRITQRVERDLVRGEGATDWLWSEDDPEADEPVGRAQVRGRLHRSDYRLTQRSGGVVVERIIAIDVRLPVPRAVFAWMLGREQVADANRLALALI